MSSVNIHGRRETITDYSGTITTGGTAQALMAANPDRNGFEIWNLSTEDLWFNELGDTAVEDQPSKRVEAGQVYETPIHCVSVEAVSIIGPTTGQAFVAREW